MQHVKYLLMGIGAFTLSSTSNADLTIALPRETNGIEVLLGIGPAYDESAYESEEALTETSAAIVVLSENFYIDVHQVLYRFRLDNDLSLKVYGRTDSLPNMEDIDASLHIKSGESFDAGIVLRKTFSSYYVDVGLGSDVTGTHDGLSGLLSVGLERAIARSKWSLEAGARYQDSKRSNYYFGVSSEESTASLPAFESDSTVSGYVETSFTYPVNKNFGISANVNASTIPESLRKSPRVRDDADVAEFEASLFLIWQFSVYGGE